MPPATCRNWTAVRRRCSPVIAPDTLCHSSVDRWNLLTHTALKLRDRDGNIVQRLPRSPLRPSGPGSRCQKAERRATRSTLYPATRLHGLHFHLKMMQALALPDHHKPVPRLCTTLHNAVDAASLAAAAFDAFAYDRDPAAAAAAAAAATTAVTQQSPTASRNASRLHQRAECAPNSMVSSNHCRLAFSRIDLSYFLYLQPGTLTFVLVRRLSPCSLPHPSLHLSPSAPLPLSPSACPLSTPLSLCLSSICPSLHIFGRPMRPTCI
jgi:hypothetical protein